MCDHSLHYGRKHFCRYCLHAFITDEILKRHIKDCFKINGKQRITMPKKVNMLNSKIKKIRKIKSPFITYADFESILVPENNARRVLYKQIQKHIACSYGYKLVCADDKFSKTFKTYFGKDLVYNFINNFIEESKYCSDLMKKHFHNF